MSDEIDICRLCASTHYLKDFYKTNGLSLRISSCLGLKFEPDDGLRPLICVLCEQTVNNFYKFKQKCLDIDSKLRAYAKTSESIGNTLKCDIKLECELLDDNYFKGNIESWLQDQSRTALKEKHFENDSPDEKEDIAQTLDKTLLRTEQKNTFSTDRIQLTRKPSNLKLKPEKLLCELCGNMFKTRQILEKHSITHTGLKMFSCKLCSKQFTRAAHKVVHMRRHMGIKPYTCEICGKSSTKRQDLIRHLRIHSDEKKYPCPQCDKRFKRSGDVHTHMRSHTGVRPYKCNNCDKCYTSHSGLKKHHRSHLKSCKKESPVK